MYETSIWTYINLTYIYVLGDYLTVCNQTSNPNRAKFCLSRHMTPVRSEFFFKSIQKVNKLRKIHTEKIKIWNEVVIYIYTLLVMDHGVCLFFFVSNIRQNGWTDRAYIWCGTSRDPREDLWMIKFSKFASNKIWFLTFILITREIFSFDFTYSQLNRRLVNWSKRQTLKFICFRIPFFTASTTSIW